jgi:hypothetical protein
VDVQGHRLVCLGRVRVVWSSQSRVAALVEQRYSYLLMLLLFALEPNSPWRNTIGELHVEGLVLHFSDTWRSYASSIVSVTFGDVERLLCHIDCLGITQLTQRMRGGRIFAVLGVC